MLRSAYWVGTCSRSFGSELLAYVIDASAQVGLCGVASFLPSSHQQRVELAPAQNRTAIIAAIIAATVQLQQKSAIRTLIVEIKSHSGNTKEPASTIRTLLRIVFRMMAESP